MSRRTFVVGVVVSLVLGGTAAVATRSLWRAESAAADSNKAQLDNLKVQLDYTRIRAPISGRMSVSQVSVGSFVRPSELLANGSPVSPRAPKGG